MSVILSDESKEALWQACDFSVKRDLSLLDAEKEELTEKEKLQLEKLDRAQRRFYWKYVNTTGKKVIVIAAITVALSIGTVAAVEPLRTPIVQFITQTFEKFTQIFFKVEQSDTNNQSVNLIIIPEKIEQQYKPMLIPDGFIEDYSDGDDLSQTIVWYNEAENTEIEFKQMILAYQLTADTENAIKSEKTSVDGFEAFYVLKDYGGIVKSSLIWTDNNYAYFLCYQGTIDKETFINIAKSTKAVE